MAFLNDRIYDEGLNKLNAEATKLYLCTAAPTTYAEASSTFAIGVKNTPTVSTSAARSGGGREVTISTFTDGSVTGSGTGTHWGLVDHVNSRLLAADLLTSSQVFTSGNSWQLNVAAKIGIPGAT